MDSQATLVDYNASLPDREARTVLYFSRDSLLNTTLYLKTHHVTSAVYHVDTNRTSSRTDISKVIPGSDQPPVKAISIQRNELLPDKITFQGVPSLRTSSWLKKRTFSDPLKPDMHSPRFVWKHTGAREVALYREDIPLRPIAWFRSSFADELASLSLQPEAEVMQDAVLASLIIVEQKNRVRTKRAALPRGRGVPVLPS